MNRPETPEGMRITSKIQGEALGKEKPLELEGSLTQGEVAGLKQKYPFLKEVIRLACDVPLSSINFGHIDSKLLDMEPNGFRYDSGYEYDWYCYVIEKNRVHDIGAPTIKKALEGLEFTPDFVVIASKTTEKHNGKQWRDVELTIYEQTRYYRRQYSGWKEPVDEMFSSPTESIFAVVEAKTEKEAEEKLKDYKPEFRNGLATYSVSKPITPMTEHDLVKLTKDFEKDSHTSIVRVTAKKG